MIQGGICKFSVTLSCVGTSEKCTVNWSIMNTATFKDNFL